MNFGEMFVCLVIGLALPFALLDGIRGVLKAEMPRQEAGFQLEMRLVPWLLTIITGPGLLVEALADRVRLGSLSANNLLAGALIVLVWATVYGFVVLKVMVALLPTAQ